MFNQEFDLEYLIQSQGTCIATICILFIVGDVILQGKFSRFLSTFRCFVVTSSLLYLDIQTVSFTDVCVLSTTCVPDRPCRKNK